MAAFRFTPKYAGMPTDSEIIMHAFKCYLAIKEPYAIPPLIEASNSKHIKTKRANLVYL